MANNFQNIVIAAQDLRDEAKEYGICGIPDFTDNKKKQKNERNDKLSNSI